MRGLIDDAKSFLRLLALCSLLAAGCSADATSESGARDQAQVARTRIERGPVTLTVEVAPSPARLSDEPALTLTIDAAEGILVEKPPFGEALGDFLIRDFREPLPEVKDGRQILRQVYTLEPMRTGTLQIDPIAVRFTDQRPQGDGQLHTAESEALAVDILTVVQSDLPSLDQLEGLADPVAVPQPRTALVWSLIGLGLLAAAGGLFWRFRRRAASSAEQQLSPREWAWLALERLEREQLSTRDVKRFYVELTGIVRQYIERTTGVRAAEQTTQEFLREIGSGDTFGREERQRLKSFLEAADLVKFAAHRPDRETIDESFRRARVFVGLAEQEVAA